jgi:hypothetical protein
MIDNTELGSAESRERFGLETRLCEWKTSTAGLEPIIDEFQEVVVATNDLPLADWRRAYRFSFFAAALYNLRLLRVVLHHVSALGVDLRDYVEHLTEQLATGAPGTIYRRLDDVLERYVDTVVAGGPFVLPVDGGAAVYVDEALAATALRDYDGFLAETEQHTRQLLAARRAPSLAEAFRYQSLITPRWRHSEPTNAELSHDWPAYVAAGGSGAPLLARTTRVRYLPPSYTTLDSFASFMATHTGCMRVRMDAGVVEAYRPTGLTVLASRSP